MHNSKEFSNELLKSPERDHRYCNLTGSRFCNEALAAQSDKDRPMGASYPYPPLGSNPLHPAKANYAAGTTRKDRIEVIIHIIQ